MEKGGKMNKIFKIFWKTETRKNADCLTRPKL